MSPAPVVSAAATRIPRAWTTSLPSNPTAPSAPRVAVAVRGEKRRWISRTPWAGAAPGKSASTKEDAATMWSHRPRSSSVPSCTFSASRTTGTPASLAARADSREAGTSWPSTSTARARRISSPGISPGRIRIRASLSHRIVLSPESSWTRMTANWEAAPGAGLPPPTPAPLSPKKGKGEPPVLVAPHVPHVHRPKTPPRQRHEGGGHLPPSLPRETGHPEFFPRHGVARNAAQVIDRIQPDSDDVEHGSPFYPGEAAPPSGNLRETAGRGALSNEQGQTTALRRGDHAWDPSSGKGLGESRSPSWREWPFWDLREE